jgi:predicted ribosomally synthesized peptide with SipW-like signal peptide
MKRSILLSMVVIGAIAAMVTAGAFSAFSDTATGTGTITAATIDVIVDGDADDDVVLTFSPQNLLPGESSSDSFSVLNNGNRDVHLVATPVVSGGTGGCPNGNLTPVVFSITDTPTDDHGGNIHIADGSTETGTVTATLVAGAPEACQGVTFTITVTFVATGVADGS